MTFTLCRPHGDRPSMTLHMEVDGTHYGKSGLAKPHTCYPHPGARGLRTPIDEQIWQRDGLLFSVLKALLHRTPRTFVASGGLVKTEQFTI
jgi:hypothetical protein